MLRTILLLLVLLPSIAFGRGLAFSEEMHGYGYWQSEFRHFDVYLDITIADIDTWRYDANHPASVRGWLLLEGGQWQSITGTLAILAPSPGDSGRLLTYKLSSATTTFFGAKHVYDDRGFDLVDDMTTLRGVIKPAGAALPTLSDILYRDAWSSELRFEWWDTANLASFVGSFDTIDTWWWDDLEVMGIFVRTTFGGVASVFFPWL